MYNNQEHYNFQFEPVNTEEGGAAELQNHYQPQTPPSAPDPKRPNRNGGLRVVALALSCALVGGVGGGAIVSTMYGKEDATTTMSQTETTQMQGESGYNSIVDKTTPTERTPKAVYNDNVHSVVGITTSGSTSYGQFQASGSGFVISADGYIVTNHHVIDGASTIQVALFDGTTYDAKLVGSDASNDVALLKVEASELHAVSIGDSAVLEVGDQVIAIGNPLGKLTFSLTAGYVSALDRTVNTDGTPINMLQTDVAINSGNSGGPLFDMDGNVVGITTAKYSGSSGSGASIEGIGFAIPINDVMSIVKDLQAFGYVTGQAFLGVSTKDLDATVATAYSLPLGVFVVTVTEDSCAATAGLQQGDIITKLGDRKTESYSELAAALKQQKAGDKTTITVYRAGETLSMDITLDEKQPQKPAEAEAAPTQPQEQQPQIEGNPFGDFFGFNW